MRHVCSTRNAIIHRIGVRCTYVGDKLTLMGLQSIGNVVPGEDDPHPLIAHYHI
jgi:hypothetical protein